MKSCLVSLKKIRTTFLKLGKSLALTMRSCLTSNNSMLRLKFKAIELPTWFHRRMLSILKTD